jgi:hypothetical protein
MGGLPKVSPQITLDWNALLDAAANNKPATPARTQPNQGKAAEAGPQAASQAPTSHAPAPTSHAPSGGESLAARLYRLGEDFSETDRAWEKYQASHGLEAVSSGFGYATERLGDSLMWLVGKVASLTLDETPGTSSKPGTQGEESSAQPEQSAPFGSADYRSEVVDWYAQATGGEGPSGSRVEPAEVSSLGQRLSASGVPHPRQLHSELDGSYENPGLLPRKPYGDDYYKLPKATGGKLTYRESQAQTIFYSWMVDEAARQAREQAPVLPALNAAALQQAQVSHQDSSTIQDPTFRCGTNPGLYSVTLADGTKVEIQHMPEEAPAEKKSALECTVESDDRKGKILLAAHGADGKYRRLDEASANALLDKVGLSRTGCRVLQLHQEPMAERLGDWLSHYSKSEGSPYVAPEQFASEVYPRLLRQLAGNTVFDFGKAKPADGYYGDVPPHDSLYELGALLGKSPEQVNAELLKTNPSIKTLY